MRKNHAFFRKTLAILQHFYYSMNRKTRDGSFLREITSNRGAKRRVVFFLRKQAVPEKDEGSFRRREEECLPAFLAVRAQRRLLSCRA